MEGGREVGPHSAKETSSPFGSLQWRHGGERGAGRGGSPGPSVKGQGDVCEISKKVLGSDTEALPYLP